MWGANSIYVRMAAQIAVPWCMVVMEAMVSCPNNQGQNKTRCLHPCFAEAFGTVTFESLHSRPCSLQFGPPGEPTLNVNGGVDVLEKQERWGWWLCQAHTKIQFFGMFLDVGYMIYSIQWIAHNLLMICFALNRPLRWLGSCTWHYVAVACVHFFFNFQLIYIREECSKWYVKARLHSDDASPYPSNPACHLLKLEPCMCLLHVQKSRFKIKETHVTFQKTLIYLKPVPNTRAELNLNEYNYWLAKIYQISIWFNDLIQDSAMSLNPSTLPASWALMIVEGGLESLPWIRISFCDSHSCYFLVALYIWQPWVFTRYGEQNW